MEARLRPIFMDERRSEMAPARRAIAHIWLPPSTWPRAGPKTLTRATSMTAISHRARMPIRWDAAAVLSIHAMIEVTASCMVSGMLWALIIGTACTTTRLAPSKVRSNTVLGFVIVTLLGSAAVFGMRLPSIARWEQQLTKASQPAVEIAFERLELNGRHSPELNALEFEGRSLAIEYLTEASQSRPTHMPTRIAGSQQMLWMASVLDSMDQHEAAVVYWDQALELIEEGVEQSPGASGYQWLGSVWFGRAMQFPDDPIRGQWLLHARDAWVLAVGRSPLNPHLAMKLMDLAIERGVDADISMWANRALKLHEQSRLDPLRGLNESDLMRVRRHAR